MTGCRYSSGLIGNRDSGIRYYSPAGIGHTPQQLLRYLPIQYGCSTKNQKAEHQSFKAPVDTILTASFEITCKRFHGSLPVPHQFRSAHSFVPTKVIRSNLYESPLSLFSWK